MTIKQLTVVIFLVLPSSLSIVAHAQVGPGGRYEISEDKQEQSTETRAALKSGLVPVMPSRANTSGYCCALVDIGVDGKPTKIKIDYCSSRVFKRPTKRSSKGYIFNPAIRNGKPIAIYGQPMITRYKLYDVKGRYMPDPEHKTLINGKSNFDVDRLCSPEGVS